jgi:hypothetical protein
MGIELHPALWVNCRQMLPNEVGWSTTFFGKKSLLAKAVSCLSTLLWSRLHIWKLYRSC